MDIDGFIEYISKQKRYSHHTVLGYKTDLLDFSDYCHKYFKISIQQVSHREVRSWFSQLMDDGFKPRTIHRKSSSLKSFFKYLIIQGAVLQSPMDLVPLPKLGRQLPKFVEEKSLDILLNEIEFPQSFEGKRDKLIIDLFYQTGIRKAELISLTIDDVNFHLNQIKVLGKRNKERIIPISCSLIETIKEYLTYRKPSLESNLLITSKGKALYPKLVYNIVNENLSKVTTLSKKSPHVLRHSFATHMLNNGAELNSIKELLGHVNLAATQVYTHNSLEKIKSIYKQAHPRA
ncbi:MAG: integrase/recombinase XerC [Flavobacteriales bacterium]|jgi:integrase/recombinase XerC|tara:strand:+ start:16060 stop:16929 length:870 start_codon:yes stop_codon:yes gene_type:complete